MKNQTRIILILVIMLTFAVFFTSCSLDKQGKALTKENYEKIIVDQTTYDEVVEILGKPNTDTKLSEAGIGILLWFNKDKTKSISLSFSNNIVTVKQQTGIDKVRNVE